MRHILIHWLCSIYVLVRRLELSPYCCATNGRQQCFSNRSVRRVASDILKWLLLNSTKVAARFELRGIIKCDCPNWQFLKPQYTHYVKRRGNLMSGNLNTLFVEEATSTLKVTIQNVMTRMGLEHLTEFRLIDKRASLTYNESHNVFSRKSEMPSEETTVDDVLRSIERETPNLQKQINDRYEAVKDTPGKGPVLSGARDLLTGNTFFGQNTKAVSANLHTLLHQRLTEYLALPENQRPQRAGVAGSHAEINALSEALAAREAITGQQVTTVDLDGFLIDNVWLRGTRIGTAAPRCVACRSITRGISVTDRVVQVEAAFDGTDEMP